MTDDKKITRPILRLNSFKQNEIRPEQEGSNILAKTLINRDMATSSNQEAVIKSEKNKVKKNKTLLSDDDYQAILQYLQIHYSKCFPSEGSPVPLAVGIHNQIFVITDLPFSKMKTRKFLKIYTSQKKYRKELIIDNNRFNLNGTPSSKILEEDINWTIWKEIRAEKRKIANHDLLVKKIMENPIAAVEFLEEFLPMEFKDMLNLTTLKVEKESYIEDSLKTRFSDIVYSVKTKPEKGSEPKTAFIYTLLEHQSSSDRWIALRLWKYSLLLLERHAKKKNKLPIILPLVLYNGKRKYSAPRNIWELFAYPALVKKAMVEDYNLIDLNAMSDDDINYEKHLSFVLYSMKHIHDRDTLKMLEKAMQRCTKALIIDKGKDYVHTKLIL